MPRKYNSEFAQALTEGKYRAFSRFSRWLGREATREDITADSVDEFAASDFQKSITHKHSYNQLCSLRAMVDRSHSVDEVKQPQAKAPQKQSAPIPSDALPPTKNYDAGLDTAEEYNGEMTLATFFIKQYRPKRLMGKSLNTTRLYDICIRKFSRWLGRPAVLSDLNDDAVAAFLSAMAEVRSLHTVERDYCSIIALWRFAARRRLVEVFPEISKPQGPAPIPDAWSKEELNKLLATAKEWEGNYSGVDAGLWWEALIRTIYDTGERVGALLKIEPHHLANGWLSVPALNRKGRLAGKQFKLSERTFDRLQQVAASQQERYLFHWPLGYTYIWHVYGKILEAAGLPNNRRTKLHKIRRTVATFYESCGGNATELLGHSSRKITEAYLDARYIKTPQPCDLIEPL